LTGFVLRASAHKILLENVMQMRPVRLLRLAAALGMFVGVSSEASAQGFESPVQVTEPRSVYSRRSEITISVRVDRLLGRIDVTTTIPVDDLPAVPPARYDVPAARMSHDTVPIMMDEGQGLRQTCGVHDLAPNQTLKIPSKPID
jgi:hypothetical protein